MKTKLVLISGAVLGSMALAGCGGGNSNDYTSNTGPTPPVPVVTTQLDTAEVLAIIQTNTSDTSSPFAVDGGAIAVTPANDSTGEPIMVNGS
jgi:hypothetical protein